MALILYETLLKKKKTTTTNIHISSIYHFELVKQ